MEDDKDAQQVDEKLYSRQLYVMGHEAQKKMMVSDVLVVGLSGLGVEVAKNIILAGVKSVTLYDPSPVTYSDLGGNFYFDESVVGAPRASTCAGRLSELNQYVPVKVVDTLSPKGMSCCVVTVPMKTEELLKLNESCRTAGCAFISSQVAGVFSQVFCDFGAEFIVADKDGEAPQMSQIEAVTVSNPGVCKVLEDHGRHGLESGDTVKFSRVQGMPELSETEHVIKSTGPFTFEIGDCSGFSGAATQGYITQVKKPVKLTFKPLSEALDNPGELMLSDFAKFDRPGLLHAAFRGLAKYTDTNGPITPGDATAGAAVVSNAKGFFDGDLSEDQEKLIASMASGSTAVLSPMCAAIGGIVGQEVLKACSGKFTPINGFLYFDAAETLPDEPLPAGEVAPRESRYDSQIACFGFEAQQKILKLSYFLVGGGAIGCEMLKNWAMMGVACGKGGEVHITDMDRIEKSNLSRQFLFRNTDINSAKSTTGAKAAKVMNPSFNITPHELRVGSETEDIFGDNFYDKLDGVCTALDNVEARLYMDQRCVFYGLPMLESGTLGTKGNTQIVVPGLTENYGATRDPPEKSIPVCTLKNFPNQIQHTLQWARDYFEGDFKQAAEDVNAYLSSPNFEETLNAQQNTKTETLLKIRKTLVEERPYSFEECIVWARLKFEQLFNNDIKQLLHNFPPDQVTSAGTPFWSGTKRCPSPVTFDAEAVCEDAEMKNHFDFIVACANLRAEMYGIKGNTDPAFFMEALSNVIVPDFTPKDGVKIAANEAEAKEGEGKADSGDIDANQILADLPAPTTLAGFRLKPVEFDKDIDDHMLFVTACSNLRAINYRIPTEDTHKSRAIAGKIIPAIATTTALVTGLICLELYKLVGTPRKKLTAEAYKSGFLNLAIPFMTLSEPQPPAAQKTILKGKEWSFTAWDSLTMDVGDVTLQEFLDYWKNEYNLEISMLSFGVSMLYSSFANKAKLAERLPKKMSVICEEIKKSPLPENQLFLTFEICVDDIESGEEVEVPYVKYRFR